MPGVSNKELWQFAVPVASHGRTYHIADPIALLAGKIHNLVSLDQDDRNDARHLEMLKICVPTFLAKQLQAVEKGSGSAKQLLQQFERLLQISLSASARRFAKHQLVEWSGLLPLKQLEQAENLQIGKFFDMRLPHWGEQLLRAGLTP